MRFMNIPPFPRTIKISDFEFFLRARLSQKVVAWPEQAIRLVGYMGWPSDPEARAASVSIVRQWSAGSSVVPPRLRSIQTDWVRVADIFNLHHDMTAGGHQQRRGGPSIGKAIAVAAGSTQARGAHAANLWRAWGEYKDVAHLVTAATIISHDARHWAEVKAYGEFGLEPDQLQPFPIAMMMPDFVMSLALSFQEYGLSTVPQPREDSTLDPETLWRVPQDVNVVAVPPPVRKIDRNGLAILNARRAGNRGRSKISRGDPPAGCKQHEGSKGLDHLVAPGGDAA